MMKSKGFTLIELIVVMAILAILVLLGAPKYKNYVEEARLTKLMVECKELEKASQQYYIRHNEWPRLSDEAYSSAEVTAFSDKILDSTGAVVILDELGNYYDIDYAKIGKYISKPDKPENYILQNPVGNIYSLDGITVEAEVRLVKEAVPELIAFNPLEHLVITSTGVITGLSDSYKSLGSGVSSDIVIPDTVNGITVTSIGSYAFSGSAITSISLPNSVTSIKGYAFFNCVHLKSANIPINVKIIENLVFGYCSNLQEIVIPTGVTSIGDAAFVGTAITNVSIPSTVISIGSQAFAQCINLESIQVPKSVTSIGGGFVMGSTKISNIEFIGRASTSGVTFSTYALKLTASGPTYTVTWDTKNITAESGQTYFSKIYLP